MLSKPAKFLGLDSSRYIQIALLVLVVCLAALLRILALDDRPFHNDEGVNFYFIQSMFKDGFFKYSHQNYHGPSYFYLTAFFENLIGQDEYGHRMSAVVSSIGMIMCPLFLGNLVSFRSKLYSMLFLTLSSSGLYYGRYAIHESFLVFASLGFSIFMFRWLETRERGELVWIGLFLGLMISTKETFIIHFAATGGAAIFLYGPLKIFTQLARHYMNFLLGLLVCLLVMTILFSGFFRHPDGLRELFFGIPQWVGRGHSDTGHHKPYPYYFQMFLTAEPVVLLGIVPILYLAIYLFLTEVKRFSKAKASIGTVISPKYLLHAREYFFRPLADVELRFALYVSLVTLFNFLAYSYVPYKTPWLIINISAPSLLGIAVVLGRIGLGTSSLRYQIISLFTFVFIVLCSSYFALKFNFRENVLGRFSETIDPQGVYGAKNPYSYVHAYDKMVELGKDIDSYMAQHPSSKILIGTTSYWPLPFYLRRHEGKLGYIASVTEPEDYISQYQILILDTSVKLADQTWGDFRYYNMSDNQSANVYFKKDL